jgi:hypothetical protein
MVFWDRVVCFILNHHPLVLLILTKKIDFLGSSWLERDNRPPKLEKVHLMKYLSRLENGYGKCSIEMLEEIIANSMLKLPKEISSQKMSFDFFNPFIEITCLDSIVDFNTILNQSKSIRIKNNTHGKMILKWNVGE